MHSKKRAQETRIVFMGTPEFAVPSLKALHKNGYDIKAVVTQPDRPRGRGRRLRPCPVKEVALSLGLKVLQPEKASDPGFIQEIEALKPDFLVVAAYGQILKQPLLDVPNIMPVNVHGSLLPRLRGAAPIQRAILEGEEVTGITIMKMDAGMDTGPILLMEKTPIKEDDTYGSLHDRLAGIGARLLIEALRGVMEGRLHPRPQPEQGITYAPPIRKEELEIEWDTVAIAIHRKLRAFDPMPGAFTFFDGERVRLYTPRFLGQKAHEAWAQNSATTPHPGTVIGVRSGLLLVATQDAILGIEEIQWPGKRRMKIGEFIRGNPIKEGEILGKR